MMNLFLVINHFLKFLFYNFKVTNSISTHTLISIVYVDHVLSKSFSPSKCRILNRVKLRFESSISSFSKLSYSWDRRFLL
jgi:hypothetical protein